MQALVLMMKTEQMEQGKLDDLCLQKNGFVHDKAVLCGDKNGWMQCFSLIASIE